jgi:hypothetical protein
VAEIKKENTDRTAGKEKMGQWEILKGGKKKGEP